MFDNQNSACKLDDEFTLDQLGQHFAGAPKVGDCRRSMQGWTGKEGGLAFEIARPQVLA